MSATAATPTIWAPLRDWLGERLAADDLVLDETRRHAEGFSWETYTFTGHWTGEDGARRHDGFAVRREPDDGLMPPYDTRGEYELLSALHKTGAVPVATPRWLEPDPAVLGRPFYVMDRIEGYVPVPWKPDDPVAFPDEARRRHVGEQFIDLLATLHRVDPVALGLASPATDPIAAARNEIARWRTRYEEAALRPVPVLDLAFAWLDRDANLEVSGRLVPTHGDYRLGNFMLDGNGTIVALFDWELAHVSDPVEDLAWAGLRLFRGRSPRWSHLLDREATLARYAQRTDLVATDRALRFWTVVAYAKASANYLRGTATFEHRGSGDLRLAAMGHQLTFVLRLLQDTLREGG